MTNAQQFIDLVGKLYNLSEKQIQQMENNTPEIDAELKKYYWDDIKNKTNLFYARKNDKSRPRVCQILAMLESDPSVVVREEEIKVEPKVYNRPSTKLWSITNTFDKLVQVLIDGGVIADENGEYHNTRSIIDPKTNEIILQPMQWLKGQLAIAMRERPECFLDFQFASPMEQIAIAIQNNLISFKVRDWSRIAKQQ